MNKSENQEKIIIEEFARVIMIQKAKTDLNEHQFVFFMNELYHYEENLILTESNSSELMYEGFLERVSNLISGKLKQMAPDNQEKLKKLTKELDFVISGDLAAASEMKDRASIVAANSKARDILKQIQAIDPQAAQAAAQAYKIEAAAETGGGDKAGGDAAKIDQEGEAMAADLESPKAKSIWGNIVDTYKNFFASKAAYWDKVKRGYDQAEKAPPEKQNDLLRRIEAAIEKMEKGDTGEGGDDGDGGDNEKPEKEAGPENLFDSEGKLNKKVLSQIYIAAQGGDKKAQMQLYHAAGEIKKQGVNFSYADGTEMDPAVIAKKYNLDIEGAGEDKDSKAANISSIENELASRLAKMLGGNTKKQYKQLFKKKYPMEWRSGKKGKITKMPTTVIDAIMQDIKSQLERSKINLSESENIKNDKVLRLYVEQRYMHTLALRESEKMKFSKGILYLSNIVKRHFSAAGIDPNKSIKVRSFLIKKLKKYIEKALADSGQKDKVRLHWKLPKKKKDSEAGNRNLEKGDMVTYDSKFPGDAVKIIDPDLSDTRMNVQPADSKTCKTTSNNKFGGSKKKIADGDPVDKCSVDYSGGLKKAKKQKIKESDDYIEFWSGWMLEEIMHNVSNK